MSSEGWVVGAVVTDNAAQCARARRILALRWPGIIFLFCFAHQVRAAVYLPFFNFDANSLFQFVLGESSGEGCRVEYIQVSLHAVS